MASLNIHQRLHAAMGDVDYVQKEKKSGMRYSIVSHDAVTAKVRPVLVKHGVVYYPVALTRHQNGNRTEIDLTVRFANIDEPADHIDVVTAGYGVDDQDKGPGKAISYAVKYALLKALGLESGDDPEETQDDTVTHKGGVERTNGAGVVQPNPPASPHQVSLGAQRTRAQEEWFRGKSLEIPTATLKWADWRAKYLAAIHACRTAAELKRLETDNNVHVMHYAKTARPEDVESFRLAIFEGAQRFAAQLVA